MFVCFTVRLESKDVILKIQWSDWDTKKQGNISRIKVEFQTALVEEKDDFERNVIRHLLDQHGVSHFHTLRNIIDDLFKRFSARLYQIAGGCIELWVMHESYEKLELMRANQDEIERMLTDHLCLIHTKAGGRRARCTVSFLDVSADDLDMHKPEMFPARYLFLYEFCLMSPGP